jgi:hypothetical protein
MLLFLPVGREHDTFKTLNEFLHIAYTIKRQREIHYVVFHFKKRLNETVKLIAANDLRQRIYDKGFTTNDFTTNDFTTNDFTTNDFTTNDFTTNDLRQTIYDKRFTTNDLRQTI